MNPPIIDLHQDLLSHIAERKVFKDIWQTNFDMLERQNAKLIVATAFPVPKDDDFLNPETNQLIESQLVEYAQVGHNHAGWSLVAEHAHLDMSADKPRILSHIEGLNCINEGSWEMLERWHGLGWRSAGLVWNITNSLGGGTNDKKSTLTPLGVKVLNWLADRKMVIDLAHMNEPTFWAALKATSGPIIVSHANARALVNHVRNLDDRQLKAIAARDGLVGVTLIGQTVKANGNATLSDLIDHIDHIRKLIGVKHIGLGSDLGGVLSGLVREIQSVDDLPKLWVALDSRGYSEEMIADIAGGNAQRVLRNILE